MVPHLRDGGEFPGNVGEIVATVHVQTYEDFVDEFSRFLSISATSLSLASATQLIGIVPPPRTRLGFCVVRTTPMTAPLCLLITGAPLMPGVIRRSSSIRSIRTWLWCSQRG